MRTYDPNRLLDALKEAMKLESDLALAELLEIPHAVISQIRHRGYPMSPSILIRMHEVSSLSIREMREIIGDRRKRVRTSYDMSYINPSTNGEVVALTQVTVSRSLLCLGAVAVSALVVWAFRF
jgi:hypothetical protein